MGQRHLAALFSINRLSNEWREGVFDLLEKLVSTHHPKQRQHPSGNGFLHGGGIGVQAKSTVYGSFSLGRGKFLIYVFFYKKMEPRCGQPYEIAPFFQLLFLYLLHPKALGLNLQGHPNSYCFQQFLATFGVRIE